MVGQVMLELTDGTEDTRLTRLYYGHKDQQVHDKDRLFNSKKKQKKTN